MTKMTKSTLLPRRLRSYMETVGMQIKLARRRRGLTISQIADRATCSELTVIRIEKGIPTVSMGAYLRVLAAMNLEEDILQIARYDPVGRDIEDIKLIASLRRQER